jgi:hypothetical protein
VRSVAELRASLTALALIALLATLGPFAHATDTATTAPSTTAVPTNPAPAVSARPSREEILAAVEKLRADPNLGTTERKRQLKRNTLTSNTPTTAPDSLSWLKWIAEAFKWFATTARVLVWVIAILLVGVLGLLIKRLVESRGEGSRAVAFTMPTHVQDLDIRPESLPDDIGGTALQLWERGEHRAALALLYRGLLSRLAHVHRIPIRDSSTEGDCLVLAAERLSLQQAAYATQLIRLWQRAVYGKLDPSAEEFRAVSVAFATALGPLPNTIPVEQAA